MRALLIVSSLLILRPANGHADSLRIALDAATTDSARLALLDKLTSAHLFRAPDSALRYAVRLFTLAEEMGAHAQSARAQNLMGRSYHMKGEHAKALAHFHEALGRFERLGNRRSIAATQSNIGSLYTDEGRYEKAVEAYRASMGAYHEEGDLIWEAGSMQGLAEVYELMGENDSAQALYGRSADILVGINAREHAALSRFEQARIALGMERDSLAVVFYTDALALLDASRNDFARCSMLAGLAQALVRLGRDDEALPKLEQALSIARNGGFGQEIAVLSLALADLHERAGRSHSALSYLRLHQQWRDSLFSAERARAIVEMQERFESERKDAELAHREAMLERRSTIIKVTMAGAALLLLAALFAWRAYHVKKRASEQLEGKNAIIGAALKEKELLLRELHHRVKNNMQTVGSLLRLQARGEPDDGTRAALHEAMMRVKSLALVHQDLYRDGSLASVRMDEYMEKLAKGLLRSHAMEEYVRLSIEAHPVRLQIDSAVPLGLILNELITNALKHAFPEGPLRNERDCTLSVALRDTGELLVLEVRDNGVGYQAEQAKAYGDEQRISGAGILSTFAETLRAEWTVQSDAGTSVRFAVRNFTRA